MSNVDRVVNMPNSTLYLFFSLFVQSQSAAARTYLPQHAPQSAFLPVFLSITAPSVVAATSIPLYTVGCADWRTWMSNKPAP